MAYNTEFIVDQVKVMDEIHQFQNAVTLVKARWRITNTDYPNGEAFHVFHKYFYHDTLEAETFVPIEDVTDAMLEQWVTGGITVEAREAIYARAMVQIQVSHAEHGLTTYYQNPDAPILP
jgi:hypothetical protein